MLDSPYILVSQSSLAQTLQRVRDVTETEMEIVSGRLFDRLPLLPPTSYVSETLRVHGHDALERPGDREIDLTARELMVIAEAYGLPSCILEILRCEVATSPALVVAENELLIDHPNETYGHAVRVGRAPQRLAPGGTVIDPFFLGISSLGRTMPHCHSGDELLFVRSGSLDLHFPKLQCLVHVDAGEYVHFYAEHLHYVTNSSASPCETWVFRIWGDSPRVDLWKQTCKKRVGHGVRREALRTLRESIAPSQDSPFSGPDATGGTPAAVIRDRWGLAHFVSRLRSSQADERGRPPTFSQLADRDAKSKINRAKLYRIHNGESKVAASQLPFLATIYRIHPLLLCDYLAAVRRPYVRIRVDRRTEREAARPEEMRELDIAVTGERTVNWQLPESRLANGSCVVARVVIPAHAETTEFEHPGQVVLLSLAGKAEVRFSPDGLSLAVQESAYAHFHGRMTYKIVNPYEVPADLLVLRVYD